MTVEDQKSYLLKSLEYHISREDWRSVVSASLDLLTLGLPKGSDQPAAQIRKDESDSIRAVDVKIPHKVDEVRSILRMADADLVDKLFPVEPIEVNSAD